MIIMPKPDRNFTVIQNDIFTNYPDMSAKAKFMLLQVLSKPANWNFNFAWLAKQNSEGIHAVKSTVQEWGANNFYHRFVIRENGRIKKVEQVLCLPPLTRDEAEQYLNMDVAAKTSTESTFQQVFTQQETDPILNTNNKQILKETKTTTPEPEPAPRVRGGVLPLPSSSSSSSTQILNLIPECHRSPMVLTLVNKAMSDCSENELKKAILYSASNVRGGSNQFRAYLDKTIKNKWADGWEPGPEKSADRQAAGEQFRNLPIGTLKMLADVGNVVAMEELKRRDHGLCITTAGRRQYAMV